MDRFISTAKRWAPANNIVRRNPLLLKKIRASLREFDDGGLSSRVSYSERRLEEVLRAAKRTPYGKGRSSDIESWPVLEPEQLRERPKDFFSPRLLPAVSASTSGTTGSPLELRRSFLSIAFEQYCLDALLQSAGLDATTARIAVLRGDTIKDPSDAEPPFWCEGASPDQLLLSSHHLSPTTIDFYIDALRSFRPDCIAAYPSTLESLLILLAEAGAEMTVPVVLTSSEMLPAETRRRCQKVLGSATIDYYGNAERTVFASSTAADSYFFHAGYGFVEMNLVGTEGAFDRYEVLGTPYWNSAMALVRYKTGDILRVPSGRSPAELDEIRFGLSSFLGIEGRSSDYLLSPDGARLIAMNHVPRGVDNIYRLQLIQETRDRVRIAVLPTDAFSDEDAARIRENIYAKIPSSMEIVIEAVDQLERLSSGKTPFIIIRDEVV